MKTISKILAFILLVTSASFAQKKGKWVKLFDGKTFTNWHVYNKAGQPITDKWSIQDGVMTFAGKAKGEKHGDDLITDKEYENFELELEWKASEGANSGIFYGVFEDKKYSVPYLTAPEIQVLDNERHPDAKAGKRHAGRLCLVRPRSLDQLHNSQSFHYGLQVYHCFPYCLVGNKQQSDAGIDRRGEWLHSSHQKSLHTMCRAVP